MLASPIDHELSDLQKEGNAIQMKNVSLILCLLGSSAFLFGSSETTDPVNPGNPVVAEIDGIKLRLADFESKRPQALFQARNTFYETEKKAVEAYIDDYLIERQAQTEQVTVAELLEKHVNAAIAKNPDEATLRIYYEGIETAEPFEAVKDKILEHLRQRRMAKLKTSYLQTLRSEAKIAILVAPPRVKVSLDQTPVRGAADASVTLVEFADYECPYCQQIQPDLNKLEAEYKGKLAFVYKDVPLPMHSRAQKAAEAAHCAGVQDKYWEYHDLLLNTKELELSQLKKGALKLALDATAFDKCLDSGEQAGIVKAHVDEAVKLGIQGTPSFFVNGRFFSGIMSYAQLHQIIEDELRAVSAKRQEASR